MRIRILHFEVVERYVMRDTRWNQIWKFIMGKHESNQYHFDVKMKVDPDYYGGKLEVNDFLELPNKVRLRIWSVEREVVRAKTYKFVDQDLRRYKPMEMYLVYPRVPKRNAV